MNLREGIECRIAGVSHGDREGLVDRLRPGDRLCLVREPMNPYDENAIEIVGSNEERLATYHGESRRGSRRSWMRARSSR